MLSDQDDIWPVNRIQFLNSALDNLDCDLVIGNFSVLPSNSSQFLPSFHHLFSHDIHPFRRVTLFDYISSSIPLFGCCFAFHHSLCKYILPIPFFVDSHDRWIAIISILKGSCLYSETIVTVRGIHSSNETKPLPLHLKLISFGIKILSIFYALARIIYIDTLGFLTKFF